MVKKAAVSLLFLFCVSIGTFIGLAVHVVQIISPWSLPASLTGVEEVTAIAWTVFDAETGKILEGHEQSEALPMASVTKFIFADAVLQTPELFSTTTITWSDLNTYGEAGSLVYGQEFSLYTLLFPLLLSSSNDAAAALERNLPSVIENINTDFTAKGLDIVLVDGSGLSDSDKASAEALSKVGAEIYTRSPHLFNITTLPYHAVAEGAWQNNSPVFEMSGYLGGKHGYTDVANHTIIAFFEETSMFGGSRVLGYVLLGSDDLERDIEILRNYVGSRLFWYAL